MKTYNISRRLCIKIKAEERKLPSMQTLTDVSEKPMKCSQFSQIERQIIHLI